VRLQFGTLALISLVVMLLLPGCGMSIHSVDNTTTPASTPTTSSAIVPTPTAQLAGGPSPTIAQAAHSPSATIQPATTPAAANTAVPAVTPSPAPRPTSAPPVQRPTVQSQPPAPTPTPVPPTPTPTPTPVPSAPNCADMPVRGFGLLWNSNPAVAQAVGCPLAPETGLSARVQLYQSGVMIWLDTLSPNIDQAPWVLTLIGDSAARYRVPANGPSWEAGSSEPTGAFEWVWNNIYSVQQSIGGALDPWYAADAAIQRFDHGTMLWLKQPPSGDRPMIFVFPDDLLNAATTTYQAYVDQGAQ
jgi:hypothetical protein